MHEMSLCLSMIDLVNERVRAEGATRVLRIGVRIGALGHVEAQALAFCFDSAARGSPAEGARLEIENIPGQAWCFDCGHSIAMRSRADLCPDCGGSALRIDDGEQMRVSEIEIV
jgi:hydrogenase nickel incorporation protein HypA/HybF